MASTVASRREVTEVANNINDYAIVIGIDEYAKLRRLSSAVRDATKFAEWLTSPEGGGLPPDNVQLILSPLESPSGPFAARPIQQDIDNCVSKLVGNGGLRVGRRLYFYFAGHAIGPTADDVAMLMADASPERLGSNIGLRPYRHFFRDAGLFDELVFILDCSRDPYLNVETFPPSLNVHTNEFNSQVKEVIIIAPPSGRRTFDPLSIKEEGRGIVTLAVLEGLQGQAVDPQGQLTSVELRTYVRRRLAELSPEVGQEPEVIISGGDIVFTADYKGTLIVELPHWTASVEIRDLFKSVPGVGTITMGTDPGVFVSETKLPAGIYEVKVTLEGKSAQQIVGVAPNQDNIVKQEIWKDLSLECAAPLTGSAVSPHTGYAEAAKHWSLNPTWDAGPNSEDSSLFVFMSATDPEARAKFASSLFLLDGEGQLVGKFSDDHVERDDNAGWVAFNAKLKPGYYVLRRGRHYRIRQQGVFLCPGWQTQVFLKTKTRRRPSLRLMTLTMARLGEGFNADDETTIAADAVLDRLRRGEKTKQLLTSEKMSALLKGKIQNPWLGILAAYVLRPQNGFGGPEIETDRNRFRTGTNRQEDLDSAALFAEVMAFLATEIPDHPDVHALRLMSEDVVTPFIHPPLLRAGLKLVQHYSANMEETIPLNSLTDLVLDNLVLNSPWTAWRELVAPSADCPFTEDAMPAVTKRRPRSRHTSLSRSASTEILLASEPSNSPAFSLMPQDEPTETTLDGSELDASSLPAISVVDLYEAILVKEAFKLTQSNTKYAGDTYDLDFKKSMNDLINSVTPKQISNSSGMPLSRITKALDCLRGYADLEAPTLDSGKRDELLSSETEQVFNQLLQNSGRSEQISDVESGLVRTSPTIEDIVLKLRVEGKRLQQVQDDGLAKELSDELGEVGNALLRQADFVLLTRPQGELMRGNGAFSMLVLPSDADLENAGVAADAKDIWRQKYQAWESALVNLPVGNSLLQSPVPNAIAPAWELQRIVIHDSFTMTTQAYLNIFRCPDSKRLVKNTLIALDALIPELTLDASYFTHGNASRRLEYADSLRTLTARIKKIIKTAAQGEAEMAHENVVADDTPAMDESQPLIDDPELKMPDATLYESEFWGIARHELIAGAAEERMVSEKAKEEVRRILAPLNGVMLSDVAGWADTVKWRGPDPLQDDDATIEFLEDPRNKHNDKWHYVNLPLDASEYNAETYPEFTRADDVVQMMRECILVLRQESTRFSELNALRMLVHLTGDVHQPAHVGCCYIDTTVTPPKLVRDPEVARLKELDSDSGGNDVLLPIGTHGVTLHSYWDSRLDGTIKPEDFRNGEASSNDSPPENIDNDAPDRALKRKFIDKLSAMIDESPPALDEAAEADPEPVELWPERWASESLVAARAAYKSLKITAPREDKFIVAWEGKEVYDKRCKPLVIQQMKLAAQNLASLLDEILG